MNSFESERPQRRSIRLPGYDYSKAGAYYLTICAHERQQLFGKVEDGTMVMNDAGRIVAEEWLKTGQIRIGIELDDWVVMPNHFHGILVFTDCAETGTARRAPTVERFGKPSPGSLPTVVRSFKSAVTKRINQMRQAPGMPVWQRNFWERVVRNVPELDRLREYIQNNPAQWETDELFP